MRVLKLLSEVEWLSRIGRLVGLVAPNSALAQFLWYQIVAIDSEKLLGVIAQDMG